MRAELVCVDGVGLLMDYLERAASPAQRSGLDAHLALCARCVAFLKSYHETPRILREATLIAMPAGLDERLRSFLQSRRR